MWKCCFWIFINQELVSFLCGKHYGANIHGRFLHFSKEGGWEHLDKEHPAEWSASPWQLDITWNQVCASWRPTGSVPFWLPRVCCRHESLSTTPSLADSCSSATVFRQSYYSWPTEMEPLTFGWSIIQDKVKEKNHSSVGSRMELKVGLNYMVSAP